MTPGINYALGAMVCYGCADLLYKRAADNGIQAHQFLMAQAWFYAPAIWLYAFASGTLEYTRAAWWGAVAGLCVYAALYNFARSLRDGAVSINAPIFRLNFVLTSALAIALLGEPLTAFKFAGLAAALAAVWLLLGGAARGARARAGSVARALAATGALGFANFAYKLGVTGGASPATLLTAQAVVFVALATAVGWRVDRSFAPARAAWLTAAAAALMLLFAFLWLLEGLRRGEASVLVPVSQMGFVVTAASGVAFLREPLTRRKSSGLLAALGALAFFAVS